MVGKYIINLVWIILVLGRCYGESGVPIVSTTDTHIYVGEHLSIEVAYGDEIQINRLETDSPPFELFINENSVDLANYLHSRSDGLQYTVLLHYDLFNNKLFFNKPGDYIVEIKAPEGPNLSSKILISVDDVENEQIEAYELFSKTIVALPFFIDDKLSVKQMVAAKQFIKKYPNSQWAKYIHFTLALDGAYRCAFEPLLSEQGLNNLDERRSEALRELSSYHLPDYWPFNDLSKLYVVLLDVQLHGMADDDMAALERLTNSSWGRVQILAKKLLREIRSVSE